MDLTDALWHRSTRSGTNGGNCVEVAALPARHHESSDPPLTAELGDWRLRPDTNTCELCR
jgi:hypothetical protein